MQDLFEGQDMNVLAESVRDSRFYRRVRTDKKMETTRQKDDGTNIAITLNQKEYYRQEDVAAFQFEKYSKLIPDHSGFKVITSTYLIRFWAPVFDYKAKGSGKHVRRSATEIAYLYILLKSYCWGKDHMWVSLESLCEEMGKSKNSVRSYLEHLEEEGFIIRFWRESNKKGYTEEETMLIKVRQTIPFLPKEKLELLPERLKKEHDKFLKSLRIESEEEFQDAYKYAEVYNELRQKAFEIKAPKVLEKNTFERLSAKMDDLDTERWELMLNNMYQYKEEATITYWFSGTIAIFEESRLSLYVKSQKKKEYIGNYLMGSLRLAIEELILPVNTIEIEVYE